jgi:glycosyltransferase involved in cell wall biosynthesis
MGAGALSSGAVAVVIPAFRAARYLDDVITRVRVQLPDATVLVVDDGSDDDTAARAVTAGAAVASHQTNLGKGRALATGLEAALALDGVRYLVTLDADGQHPPESVSALLAPLTAGAADLVVGARRRDAAMPVSRRLSNWLSSTLLARARVTGSVIPDSQSGFRAMTREVATAVRPRGRRYEFETEFLIAALRAGYRLAWVTIPTVYGGARSHFRYFSDTLAVAGVFARHWRGIVAGPGTTT